MMNEDTRHPCDDLDVRIAAAHESPDFAREVDEFEDAKRNALADDSEEGRPLTEDECIALVDDELEAA